MDNDLKDLYESVFGSDFNADNNDRLNFKNDLFNIASDINKSFKLYKTEKLDKNQ